LDYNLDMRWNRVVIFLLVAVLGIAFYWRWQLGIIRYFDVDEFAHLHWGYSLSIGELPYKDFFYLFPPFYLLPIASLFTLIGRSVSVLIAARALTFMIFVLTTCILMLLARLIRGWHIALFTACVFALMPLPYDKMLEVRPDLFSMFFMLVSIYFYILFETKQKKILAFLSGLFAGISIGIIPKAIFTLVPVVLILAYHFWHALNHGTMKQWSNRLLPLILGGLIPLLVIVGFILASGDPSLAILSMTRLPKDSSVMLGKYFYMFPSHFFWPNDVFYGVGGFSEPYKLNLAIWWIALAGWLVRFLSSLSHQSKLRGITEFTIGGAFFFNLYAFVHLIPLKHSQYLITLAPLVAFYFADTMYQIAQQLGHVVGRLLSGARFVISSLAMLLVVAYLLKVGFDSFTIKRKWTHQTSIDKLSKLLSSIPATEPIFDLTGEAIMYKNGYYVCCLPYGQYEAAIPFRLPNLKSDMERRGTRYVFVSWKDRLGVLPIDHQRYIREEFIDYVPDGSIMVKK